MTAPFDRVGEHSGVVNGWGWRTDCHALVAIQGYTDLPLSPPTNDLGRPALVDKHVVKLVTEGFDGACYASVADLLTFCGPPCPHCEDTGSVPCDECAVDKADDCWSCDGERVVDCERCGTNEKLRVVRLFGTYFNARLLRGVLRTCQAHVVASWIRGHDHDGASVVFAADGWRSEVMQMRWEGDVPQFGDWIEKP